MKLANIRVQGQDRIGVQVNGGFVVCDESWLGSGFPTELGTLLMQPKAYAQLAGRVQAGDMPDAVTAVDDVTYRPAVENPGKIVCIGLNYRKHAIETNSPIPTKPVVFSKFSDTAAACGEEIGLPSGSRQVDYEAELAVVIGRTADGVSEDEALEYVFGYCNANDLSARDLQMRTSQWLLGKTCPQFAPLGPLLVTADEVADPNNLSIRTYRNSELVQNSNTSDMIFTCKELISYLSQYMVLNPGDVILTGTPEGVVLGFPEAERRWLEAGEEVVVEVEGLGQLRNRFVGR